MSPTAISSIAADVLSVNRETAVMWRLRRWTVRGAMLSMLSHSRLRVSLVVGLSIFFWIGLFFLFRDGYQYLLATYSELIGQIFNMFFLTLMILLIFSSAIIMFSGLYRSPEMSFLLTQPVREGRLFLYKYQETLWFASWGFLLLGNPMLVAYGVASGAPWYYYALLFPFMFAFVSVPAGLGSLLCLLVVYFLPSIRRHVLAISLLVMLAGAAWLVWSLFRLPTNELLTARWFRDLSDRLGFAQQSLLPSWWFSSGLLEAARSDGGSLGSRPWAEGILFLAVLVANGMVLALLGYRLSNRYLRTSYSRLQAEFPVARKPVADWIDKLVWKGAWFLPSTLRHLIVKDVRLFRRDPLQWSQVLIFFGLLTLYFLNIRRFTYEEHMTRWINLIGFLNVAVIGLILSTFTTRFVFPMISLEGRRFWILGLLPIRRESVLWSKFLFVAFGSVIPCGLLILLSDMMLPIPVEILWIHQIDCFVLCSGLSAIAVGLGAVIPDLRETSPSKIAAGFGGTLNLVISAAFILAVVIVTAVPCHWYVSIEPGNLVTGRVGEATRAYLLARPRPPISPAWLNFLLEPPRSLWLGTGAAILLGLAATILPLRSGFRAFRELET